MPENRESSLEGGKHWPPVAARLEVARQVWEQIHQKLGAHGRINGRGELIVPIAEGVESALPSPRSLAEFMTIEHISEDADGTHQLRVDLRLPRHGYPDSFEELKGIECTVNFPKGVPTAVEGSYAEKHPGSSKLPRYVSSYGDELKIWEASPPIPKGTKRTIAVLSVSFALLMGAVISERQWGAVTKGVQGVKRAIATWKQGTDADQKQTPVLKDSSHSSR